MASMQMFPPIGCSSTGCSVQGANFQCFTCGTYYCGVSCQMNHWPTHKDFCIPRLVMATPLLGNSSLMTQFPPPAIPKQTNGVSRSTEAAACTGAVPKIPPRVVLQQEQLVAPESNGVAAPKKTPVGQTRKDDIVMTSNKKENIPKEESVSNGKNPLMGMKRNPLQALKTNQQAETVGNSEKPPTKATHPLLQALKASQPTEMVAEVDKPSTKPLSTEIKANKPAEKVVNGEKPMVKAAQNSFQALMKAGQQSDSPPKTVPPRAAPTLQHGPFPEPGRGVKISYVDKDRVYIYDAGIGPNNEPNSFQSLIVRSLQCAQTVKVHLSTEPEVADIVFAPFEDEFYRGVVKSVQNGMAEIFFPDFGNSLKTEWNKLKEIPDPKIKYAKTVTHPVWIDNVKSFTPRMKEFLETLVDTQEFVLTTVIDMPNTHIRMVEMRNSLENYLLSEKLLAMEDQASSSNTKNKLASQLKSPNNSVPKLVVTNPKTYKPVLLTELVLASIAEGKGAELLVTNAEQVFNNNKISVINETDYAMLEKLMKECQLYGQIDPNPYDPKDCELCLVKAKGIWHRAVSYTFTDGKVTQFYLLDKNDLSNVDSTTVVRRYPPGLTQRLYAAECVVENPEFLLQATNGDESKADMLHGLTIKADVQHAVDDEIGDTIHLTVVSLKE